MWYLLLPADGRGETPRHEVAKCGNEESAAPAVSPVGRINHLDVKSAFRPGGREILQDDGLGVFTSKWGCQCGCLFLKLRSDSAGSVCAQDQHDFMDLRTDPLLGHLAGCIRIIGIAAEGN